MADYGTKIGGFSKWKWWVKVFKASGDEEDAQGQGAPGSYSSLPPQHREALDA